MAAMTAAEREDFLYASGPRDCFEIADFVRQNHPEAFDAAVNRLRLLAALQNGDQS